ncbi:MAG: hypothetical protein IJ767_01980 [Bacteroidaceae bacterium]|nr:hypothetical protein [Bacteroidaceae bacterium]
MSSITDELARLHELSGAEFSRQVVCIAKRHEFHPVPGETGIFSAGEEQGEDYEWLLHAARKAVQHGYCVFILPNPQGIRTADFIFERKGIYRLYDLKTIHGKASVTNRLTESIGQSNRVLLNMVTDYSPSALARSIKHYFEINNDAREVMIFKGKKLISIMREDTLGNSYFRYFISKYVK